MKVDPDEVRILGQLYDGLINDAEGIAEERLRRHQRRGLSPFPWISPAGGLFQRKRGMMVYDYGIYN